MARAMAMEAPIIQVTITVATTVMATTTTTTIAIKAIPVAKEATAT
jgi:hypothetical protein